METENMKNQEAKIKTTTANQPNKSVIEFASKEDNLHYAGVSDIDPAELAQKLATPDHGIIVVDVRQQEEFHGELGRIPGSILHVLDQLPQTIANLPKDQAVVFVCRSGGRSARATDFALGLGYTHVYNMKGGMLLWNEMKLPVER